MHVLFLADFLLFYQNILDLVLSYHYWNSYYVSSDNFKGLTCRRMVITDN